MTTQETSVIMEAIRLAYQRTTVITQADAEKTLALWSTLWKDTPYEEVNYAVKTYIMTDASGFPPTIGQLNKIIADAKMSNLPSADVAWSLVRKGISNGLYGSREEFDALPEICQRVVGSASQLYDWAMLDANGLNVVRSTFLRRYNEVLEQDKELVALPSSLAENRQKLTEGHNKVKQLVERIGK